jgi:heavy metal translocating P-type ATPase
MRRSGLLLAAALAGLSLGAAGRLAGAGQAADAVWAVTTSAALLPALVSVMADLWRRKPGVDIVAVLALAGCLGVGEFLAGAVIAVMLATGRVLERRAAARAERELHQLLARTPREVHRYEAGSLTSPPLSSVVPGDRLLVKPGEVVPVDGLLETPGVLDESALTGEAVPVERTAGEPVRSGVVNAGAPFDLRATTTAAESTYAGIVRLVEEAGADRAPFVRLADRYALGFVPLTLSMAAATWAWSGSLLRAVAVLVVATPCPLILAAPVAITSGLSRAARRGVIVKGGSVLERLAQSEILLLDKTGTLTAGRPTVIATVTEDGLDAAELLRLAASLDQVSPHVLAAAVVRAAHRRGLTLSLPHDVTELPGHGLRGRVAGREVAIGKASWVLPATPPAWARTARRRADLDGSLTVFVAVDGRPAGALLVQDQIRPDAARTIRALRRAGIRRVVMVTGDRAEVADLIGSVVGVDATLAERTPAEKVEAVMAERRAGTVIMVGDGLNDAPALALADVGVALGSTGSSASSEAADVVLTVDRLDRLADALHVARRARAIALQSVLAGMGLSLAAMVAAALGALPVTAGAVLQEAIDVAAIGNALRVLTGTASGRRLTGDDARLSRRFSAEHRLLRPDLDRILAVADALGGPAPAETVPAVVGVQRFLVDDLLPHEQAEERQLYPVLDRVLGGEDPTGTMVRAHAEIAHLVRRLGRLLDELPPAGPDADEITELRRTLYGLHAILTLHFAQEDEGYLSLTDDEDRGPAAA